MPVVVEGTPPESDEGPVLVTVEYSVPPDDRKAFLSAIHRYGRVRRRDGASRWGIFKDIENPDVFVESFLVNSWAEHLRQHERLTRADSSVEQAVRSHTRGDGIVRHFIYAKSER